MIVVNTEKGKVSISSRVYTQISGIAATNCFGVKGMAFRSRTDGLVHLLRKEAMTKGVYVHFEPDDAISIDMHIVVKHGVNIPVLTKSIISEVRYVVASCTGTQVQSVNVFVDSIVVD